MTEPRRATRREPAGRWARWAALLCGAAVLLMTVLVCFDVAMRYLLNQPQLFVDEVVSFLQVLVVFIGLAFTFRSGAHIRVDLVTARLGDPVRAWLRVVTLVIALAIVAVSSWVTAQSTLSAYRDERVSTVMLYPIWMPMALIPTGLVLLGIAVGTTMARQLGVLRGPRHAWREVTPDATDAHGPGEHERREVIE